MVEPPSKLDYLNPESQPPPPFNQERFVLGLGLGVVASFLIWFLGWNRLFNNSVAPTKFWIPSWWIVLLLVPALKIAISVVLMSWPRWRSCGIGLLISIPLGALIFFGSCAAHL